MNQYDLKGRVAVVTGGARGIGYAVAERLTQSGARVALWDMDTARAEQSAKALDGAAAVTVDITDEAAVARAVAETESRVGPIDVVVNSAAITGPNATVAEYPVDAWRKTIDINLTGTFLVCRAVVPGMQRRDYGRIVNIASIAGKEGNPNASAYSASKAAVIALTKSLGKELAKTGIRVNCITPAAVKTEMFSQMTEQHINYMLSKIPMERFGKVEEMAALVTWLSSEDCSFSTGATFDISGGRATY
jgi:3-oxoacyl-[acyl-carrier protein] reductase